MANPFAAAASSNPFAAATAAAPAAANPFATAAAPAAANPFATAASTAASNPFAAATTTTMAANPFAAVTTTSTAANPFATAAAPAPASANPFATAAAPAAANPFATATTAAGNPFATAGAAAATAGAAATIISPQLINDVQELRAVYMPDLSRLSQYKQFKHILYNLRDPRIDRCVSYRGPVGVCRLATNLPPFPTQVQQTARVVAAGVGPRTEDSPGRVWWLTAW